MDRKTVEQVAELQLKIFLPDFHSSTRGVAAPVIPVLLVFPACCK